jgi:hypothetical protein
MTPSASSSGRRCQATAASDEVTTAATEEPVMGVVQTPEATGTTAWSP